MTFLELVNSVLIQMREDQVDTWDENDYSTLIGKYVNKAKEICEDAHLWQRLRTTIQITTVAGESSYVLTGAGKRFQILIRDNEGDRPDVWNDTDDIYLYKAPSTAWMTRQLNDNNVTQDIPTWFDINGYDSNDDPIVDLYPIPNGAKTINFNLKIPQEAFTSDSDSLVIPDGPVEELAYLFALEERGEDAGTISDRIEQFKNTRLADAIALDQGRANDDDLIWEVI